jgi:hypothetical protein
MLSRILVVLAILHVDIFEKFAVLTSREFKAILGRHSKLSHRSSKRKNRPYPEPLLCICRRSDEKRSQKYSEKRARYPTQFSWYDYHTLPPE